MQYKTLYEDLKWNLKQAERKLEEEKNLRIECQEKYNALSKLIETREGMELVVKIENDWLRDTLRMLIIPPEKMKNLSDHIVEAEKRANDMGMISNYDLKGGRL